MTLRTLTQLPTEGPLPGRLHLGLPAPSQNTQGGGQGKGVVPDSVSAPLYPPTQLTIFLPKAKKNLFIVLARGVAPIMCGKSPQV